MTDRSYVHVDPATGYADPADLGSGGAGAGAKVLADNHTFITPPGGAPSGAAGGDLSGAYPNPAVVDDSHSHSHDSTITGVSADDHHSEDHVLATATALGTHHTISGGVAGYVLRALTATTAKLMQLVHADLGSVGANDHHNQLHQAAHNTGAGDALKLDDLETPDDNTDLNATTGHHGLLRKLDGVASHALGGDGNWFTPAGTGAVASDPIWDAAGDLAVGTGADTAAKLGLTVPAANILEVLAVANGETTPTWKPLHDATSPAAIGPAAAGTSLLAAHRDHAHAHAPAIDAVLAGDVTMTTANTFYDGPSGSFGTGIWLIFWKALFETSGTTTHQYSAKLWDGSTVYDQSQNDCTSTNNGHGIEVSGCATVTLAAPATLKVSGSDVHNSQKMLKNPNANSAGNNSASRLVGIRIG